MTVPAACSPADAGLRRPLRLPLPVHSPPLAQIDGELVELPTSIRADPLSLPVHPPLPPLYPAFLALQSPGRPMMPPQSPIPNVLATSSSRADGEPIDHLQPPVYALCYMISGARAIEIIVLVS